MQLLPVCQTATTATARPASLFFDCHEFWFRDPAILRLPPVEADVVSKRNAKLEPKLRGTFQNRKHPLAEEPYKTENTFYMQFPS